MKAVTSFPPARILTLQKPTWPIASDIVVTGEVGLTGEIRAVSYIEKRIAECKKLGFKKIVIPRNNYEVVKDVKGIEIIPVDNLRQAINIVLRG